MSVSEAANPLARHGKVSYLEIPALNPEASAAFYEAVFSWRVERRADGRISFDDGTGELIGRWLADREPSRQSGFLPYIYVHNVAAAVEAAVRLGAELVEAPRPEGDLTVAQLRDPAGNVVGVWQFVAGGSP